MVSKINKNKNLTTPDILDIVLILWDNKSKIFLGIILSSIVFLSYYFNEKPIFKATTEIKSISNTDELKYQTYNFYFDSNKHKFLINFNETNNIKNDTKNNTRANGKNRDKKFQEINKLYLLNYFIDTFRESKISRDIIIELNIIDKNNYQTDESYNNAVSKLASSIKFFPPNKNENGKINLNWKIVSNISDRNNWNNFLKRIEKEINENVRISIKDTIDNFILNEEKLKKFEIEDINQEISNSLQTYEENIKNRLVFLNEQAQIARSLNIDKNNLFEEQIFLNSSESGVISKMETAKPYFMRGYITIEKEIDLIKNRTEKKAFIPELEILEKTKKELITDKYIDRFKDLIIETPIVSQNNFKAAKIKYYSTTYESNRVSVSKISIFALLFGFFVSAILILIEYAIKYNKLNLRS